MSPRLAATCALALAACDSGSTPGAPDAGAPDAPTPDAPPIDEQPPRVLAIEPASGAEIWLAAPLRLELDEPIALAGVAAAAALDGRPIAVALALDGDRALIARFDPAARGVGTLELTLSGIADRAGNAAEPIALAYAVAPWHRPAIDRGIAAGRPALAVGTHGEVVAAWTVGPPGARRVVASEHAGGGWRALGDVLGDSDAPAVAIALDPDQHPVAGWIEDGATRLARWDGAAWRALPALGRGSAIALAAAPGGGAITAVVVDATLGVYRLEAGAWQPLGTLAPGGAVAGPPAIAVPAAGEAVVGWSAGGAIRVWRHAGAWTELPPIAAATANVALAARGGEVAIAWEQVAGSSGVYAARASGGAWTRLGRALDVDVAGEASAPAIALAGTTPIVAWRERIETAERGVVARWRDGAWQVVGGPSWLPGGSAAPSAPVIAAGEAGAPVIGWTAAGALGVARFNGPADPAPGLATRPSLAGCAFSTDPPARLLATGCFTLAAPGRPVPHAGLVPYDVVVELWSDGTRKRRWLAPPDGASMLPTGTGAWTGPVGTFVVKEFAIETTPGDPATRRAIETRFLVRTPDGWDGFTYRWRRDGSDADLLPDGAYTFDWPLAGGETYRHLYPSRTQCRSCHHPSYGPLLGVRPPQLRRWFDYDGVIADQLATLAAIGVGVDAQAAPFVSPHDASAGLQTRVRGYLAANCPQCHNPSNVAIKDLRYGTPLAQTRLCEVIVPGQPAASRLYQLLSSRPGMPPYATLAPDPLALELVGRWITGMTSCP